MYLGAVIIADRPPLYAFAIKKFTSNAKPITTISGKLCGLKMANKKLALHS